MLENVREASLAINHLADQAGQDPGQNPEGQDDGEESHDGGGPLDATQLPVTILGGGGGKLKGGRILDYRGKPHRQMCSLFLSLMDKFDIRLKRFGDSATRLEEV